jgi:hypothetical protein
MSREPGHFAYLTAVSAKKWRVPGLGLAAFSHSLREYRVANMDTCDVSGSSQYIQLLVKQKEFLNAAKARQGERPKDRKSRKELVNNFVIQHTIQQIKQSKRDNTLIYTSFVPPPYPPCIAPLEKLKQMFIKDLQLETHHCGNYLLVKSITPLNRITAIIAIVVDEKEDAIVLQLYQQDEKSNQPATSIIKQGNIFLVKEPYFKVIANREYRLRIDHLSDIICIKARDKRLPKQWSPQVFDVGKTAHD